MCFVGLYQMNREEPRKAFLQKINDDGPIIDQQVGQRAVLCLGIDTVKIKGSRQLGEVR